jgi:hypothetical protein
MLVHTSVTRSYTHRELIAFCGKRGLPTWNLQPARGRGQWIVLDDQYSVRWNADGSYSVKASVVGAIKRKPRNKARQHGAVITIDPITYKC